MEYIYSLFGGVFLTDIYFLVYKSREKESFYNKLPYFMAIPVLLYLIYIIFFIFQNLTTNYGSGLGFSAVGKIGLFILTLFLLLLVLYLQFLMFKTSKLILEKKSLKYKMQKALVISFYSLVQGVALHAIIWASKAGMFFEF